MSDQSLLIEQMKDLIEMNNQIVKKDEQIIGNLLPSLFRFENFSFTDKKSFDYWLERLILFTDYHTALFITFHRRFALSILPIEKKMLLNKLDAIIVEGYKVLWGYEKNENGKKGNRDKSLIYNLIYTCDEQSGSLITISEMLTEYEQTCYLEKDIRELTTHFSKKNGTFEDLQELTKSVTLADMKRIVEYLSILVQLTGLVSEYTHIKNFEYIDKVPFSINDINILRTQKILLLKHSESFANNILETFNKLIKSYKAPSVVQYMYPDCDFSCASRLAKSVIPTMQICFSMLDMISIFRGYLTSNSRIERENFLAYLNLSIYETLNKLCCTSAAASASYWKKYMIEPLGSEVLQEIVDMDKQLQYLVDDPIYDLAGRHTTAHCRPHEIPKQLKYMKNINPKKALEDYLTMIKAGNMVMNSSKTGINVINDNISKENQLKMKPLYDKHEECVKLTEKTTNPIKKKQLLDILNDMKKLLDGDFRGLSN